MTDHDRPALLDVATYLARVPEKLVLEGYRGWTWTIAGKSREPWERVHELYREKLGERAEDTLGALDSFFRTLGQCATCPLRMRCSGAQSLCRDEVLVLGLVAGIQHRDQPTIDISLSSLCSGSRADCVAVAAAIYALLLEYNGRRLLPIPAHVVAHVLNQEPERQTPLTLH